MPSALCCNLIIFSWATEKPFELNIKYWPLCACTHCIGSLHIKTLAQDDVPQRWNRRFIFWRWRGGVYKEALWYIFPPTNQVQWKIVLKERKEAIIGEEDNISVLRACDHSCMTQVDTLVCWTTIGEIYQAIQFDNIWSFRWASFVYVVLKLFLFSS